MTAAVVMHMSATLKIGQCGSCRKSTTWPRNGPGGRNEPVGEVAGDPGAQEPERDGPPTWFSRGTSRTSTNARTSTAATANTQASPRPG